MVQQSDGMPILTVGSLAFDSISTPSGTADQVLGGSVNYFSVAASFFAPVQVVGVVGQDFPEAHLEWLKTKGVDVTGIQIAQGKTFHWVGRYDGNLNEAKTISTDLNVFEHFDPHLKSYHKAAPYLFLANIDPDLQLQVLSQMQGPRLVACDSMNFWIQGKRDSLLKVLSHVDLLSINESEASMLTGESNLVKAISKIRQLGPTTIVVKRGEYGALLSINSGFFAAPAFPLENVVDPTGAGDTFAGAMMGYLSQKGVHRDWAHQQPQMWEHTVKNAVLSGCVMASFTVEDFSLNRLKRLTPVELSARQQSMIRLTSV